MNTLFLVSQFPKSFIAFKIKRVTEKRKRYKANYRMSSSNIKVYILVYL